MRDLLEILKNFVEFIKQQKKYWLIPVAITLFILGFLIGTAGNTPVPVFVYPLA